VPEQEIPTNWWNDFFECDLWARVHRLKTREQTVKEIEFIKKVAVTKTGSLSILDIPCGLGRHSIELAREGHKVTGLDNSKNLLRIAEENSIDLVHKPEWQHGDMRTFRKVKSFDIVLTMWGSLGYFDDAETLQMFFNIHESLKPGGVLVFDQPVLDTFLRRDFSQNHWSEKDGVYVMEKTNWISETGRNESEWVFVHGGKVSSHKSSIRIFTHRELHSMLLQTGFSTINYYGSLQLKPFNAGDRLFCVAERTL
jgi:2-polyprenyl-3-methyl-5-hydroxy-6-metoxy-1,4-benzoquinol methylase